MRHEDITAAMVDIALPAPPDWGPLVAAATTLVLTAAAGIEWWLRRRRRATACRDAGALARLDRLQQAWAQRSLDEREAAYRLAALLRIGLGLRQLRGDTPPRGVADADTHEWSSVVALLQRLRYQPRTEEALSREVFRHARRWLAPASAGRGAP